MADASTIIERMRNGELILESDPDYPLLYKEFEKTMNLVGELNTGYHTADEVRALLEQIWGQKLDPTVRMFPPFYGIRKINSCRQRGVCQF